MAGKQKKSAAEKSIFERDINVPWYVWGIGILVIVLFVLWIVSLSTREVIYKKMNFEKEINSGVLMYKYARTFKGLDGSITRYSLYLLNNPKENKVPFNANINFVPERTIYFSINGEGITQCKYSSMAVGKLSEFLTLYKMGGFNVTIATANATLAAEKNVTMADCSTHPNDNVVYLSGGPETKVSQEGNCYKIEAANCEIEEAVEKFIVEGVAQVILRGK